MNVSELITELCDRGVHLWSDRNRLKIHAPKGILTPQIKADLAARKQEILTFLEADRDSVKTPMGLSLNTIGRLIGGAAPGRVSLFKPPVIDPLVMATQIKVTFRPLPPKYNNQAVLEFRELLEHQLKDYGVKIVPWLQATRDFNQELTIPLLKRQTSFKTRVVKPSINAVIDVERGENKLKTSLAEKFYQVYRRFYDKNRQPSMATITKLTSWAEDHAMQRLEDPTSTQVILLTELDRNFADPGLPYQQKIAVGINTLVKTFSEIAIGVGDRTISILNMNLADSLFSRDKFDRFVLHSLIPKIYVPISPLPLNRFQIKEYEPQSSAYAHKLERLSQELGTTGLFPSGFKLGEVITRQSHRDLVNSIVNGRSGVSYGFVAYAEPPQYIGDRQITAAQWSTLEPVPDFERDEVRQNKLGRRYLKSNVKGQAVYQQIPDIWLLSSRSGANKTQLNLERDILRIGLTDRLWLQLPAGIDPNQIDIKPSYDTYVMLAIALSAALYAPQLVENGAPMVHFHGYPAKDWFETDEGWAGVEHPSVPCGTYESGIFNFLSIYNLAQSHEKVNLASLIEPDHGTNIITEDLEHLLLRLKTGLAQGQIELGGKHFASLKDK